VYWRPAGCCEIRSRTAVAFVAFRDVSQLVSKSPATHVHVATILTEQRPTAALPAGNQIYAPEDGNRSNYRNVVFFFGGGGINEELHKSISDMRPTETF